MIKYLEVPDFHYDPKWSETAKICSDAIVKAAKENEVDFIVLPGDLFNRPIHATDKGGYNELRKIIKQWLAICPVAAVEGTPSHDGKGCYSPLEDMGLVLLRPGKVYGYWNHGKEETDKRWGDLDVSNKASKYIAEMRIKRETNAKCILFGIPEINKNHIQAQLNLPAEKANAEAINMFNDYVKEFIAPIRLIYHRIPAIALLHGIVSDTKKINSDNIIIRSSDIVIHTEDLGIANIDRWSLGHLHKPWESQIISAGYAGSWSLNWGETDFVPVMNLIEFRVNARDLGSKYHGWYLSNRKRIPYGTPERKKIFKPLAEYDPNVAYWLYTDNKNDAEPTGHPWSRITYNEKRKETGRITKEQAASIKSLSDLFKLIDPDVTERVLEKVETIETRMSIERKEPLNIKLKSLTIDGCILFDGEQIELNIDEMNDGMILIMGTDNGKGKSSICAFCPPFPVIIGKPTSSGRPSAIKDFFSKPDSKYQKIFDVNGIEHRQLITIKGAHTKNPKTECYIFIDNKSILDKATFDSMFEKCEELYGSYNDYCLTSFYVQPLQGWKSGASLMDASMTDIRNLVQNIVGINREKEKRLSLDTVQELNKTITTKKTWVEGAEEFSIDIEAIANEIKSIEKEFGMDRMKLDNIKGHGIIAKQELEKLREVQTANAAEMKKKQDDKDRINKIHFDSGQANGKIYNLKIKADNLESNKRLLSDYEQYNVIILSNATMKNSYDALVLAYNKELSELQNDIREKNSAQQREYNEQHSEYISKKHILETEITINKAEIDNLNKPCPNCKWIDPAAIEKINEAKKQLDEHQAELSSLEKPETITPLEIPTTIDKPLPIQPEYNNVPSIEHIDIDEIKQDIEMAISAQATIAELEKTIETLKKELLDIEQREYTIDTGLSEKLTIAESKYTGLQDDYVNQKSIIAEKEAKIKLKKEAVLKAKESAREIENTKTMIICLEDDYSDWQYISNMLQPAKIPALELEIDVDSIDVEATKIIEPFHEGRFAFQTETQRQGATGVVDKFDIKIYDAEKGCYKSFMAFSPGQKAFFNDAYVKALIGKRNNKSHISYSPVILDEADGPIQPERIAEYYEMQKKYWKDIKVLIVSHSPTSHEYIDTKIDIEELKNIKD